LVDGMRNRLFVLESLRWLDTLPHFKSNLLSVSLSPSGFSNNSQQVSHLLLRWTPRGSAVPVCIAVW
jgi:hypothetical protein